MPTQPLAGLFAPPSDATLDATSAQRLATVAEVVSLVSVQLLGSLARSSGPAPRPVDRRDGVDEFFERLRVVNIGSSEDYRERNASSICHNMALRTRFATVGWVLTDCFVPLFAATLAESKEARAQSILSCSPRRSIAGCNDVGPGDLAL